MDFNFTLDATPAKESTCKGQVFKGYSSLFCHKGRIERREGIRLMKSLSCPGCKDCGDAWVVEELNEALACGTLIMPDSIAHGCLYGIRVINASKDWETGYIDSFDLEVYMLED